MKNFITVHIEAHRKKWFDFYREILLNVDRIYCVRRLGDGRAELLVTMTKGRRGIRDTYVRTQESFKEILALIKAAQKGGNA